MKTLFRGCVVAGCSYELVALSSRGHVPPLSQIASRHKLLPLAILVPLAVHLYRYTPPQAPAVMGERLAIG